MTYSPEIKSIMRMLVKESFLRKRAAARSTAVRDTRAVIGGDVSVCQYSREFGGFRLDGSQTESSSREMRARLLCLVFLLAASARAARLLAVLPTNTKSHHAMYGRLLEALAWRDHQLTVITHFPMVRNY